MNNRAKISGRAVFTSLTALLVVFIFGNSAADGETSAGFSFIVTQWLNAALDWFRIPLELSHHFVRKLAHFTEYSLLGGLLTAAVAAWRVKSWRFICVWLPVVIGGALASFDEWLQTFTPDRHGCVPDVLLDLSGVAWAAVAVSLLLAYRTGCKGENNTPT